MSASGTSIGVGLISHTNAGKTTLARTLLRSDIGEIGDRVSRAADWREQVRAHPTASLAVAAVAGLMIGRQLAAMLGARGVAAFGASTARRPAPSRWRANFIADRVLAGVGTSLASALVGPVVSGVQSVLVIPGAPDVAVVMPFWQALLGYERRPDSPDEDLIDPRDRGPAFWFEAMDEPRSDGGGAIHVAVWVPIEEAEARVAAALAAGGTIVRDTFAPAWWTLADAAGNEADVASIAHRD